MPLRIHLKQSRNISKITPIYLYPQTPKTHPRTRRNAQGPEPRNPPGGPLRGGFFAQESYWVRFSLPSLTQSCSALFCLFVSARVCWRYLCLSVSVVSVSIYVVVVSLQLVCCLSWFDRSCLGCVCPRGCIGSHLCLSIGVEYLLIYHCRFVVSRHLSADLLLVSAHVGLRSSTGFIVSVSAVRVCLSVQCWSIELLCSSM